MTDTKLLRCFTFPNGFSVRNPPSFVVSRTLLVLVKLRSGSVTLGFYFTRRVEPKNVTARCFCSAKFKLSTLSVSFVNSWLNCFRHKRNYASHTKHLRYVYSSSKLEGLRAETSMFYYFTVKPVIKVKYKLKAGL